MTNYELLKVAAAIVNHKRAAAMPPAMPAPTPPPGAGAQPMGAMPKLGPDSVPGTPQLGKSLGNPIAHGGAAAELPTLPKPPAAAMPKINPMGTMGPAATAKPALMARPMANPMASQAPTLGGIGKPQNYSLQAPGIK